MRQSIALTRASCALAILLCGHVMAQVKAFPEAEGFGANATGGRGGSVYHVTNLNDSGAGSFRDAVSQQNRIVVFDVGGWIDLQSPVSVSSNITIAGQTAPGNGIGLRNYQLSFSGATNVIARHLRSRQGPDFDSVGRDAITINAGTNIILDHVSATWGRDENLSVTNSASITVQNSIIGEGLLNHSMGGLIEWNTISMHHNLYLNNNDRNPKTKGSIDFVNNVVVNWGAFAYVAGDSAGVSEGNVVGNYFIAGPSSSELHDPISRGNANYRMYMQGNWWDGNQNGTLDGHELLQSEVDDNVTWMGQRFNYPLMPTDSAELAYEKVLAMAGPSISRDSVDTRLVNLVKTQTGAIISDPASVGGWGTLNGAPAPLDTDQDGMPDSWELEHGLSINDPADRNNVNHFGYTRLEQYLNELGGAYPKDIWTAPSGSWNTQNLWQDGSAPRSYNEVFIRGNGLGGSGKVSISNAAEAHRVNIGGNGGAGGERVSVGAGGSLVVRDVINVGHQNKGTLEIQPGSAGVTAPSVVLGSHLHAGELLLHGGRLRTSFLVSDNAGSTFSWNGGTLEALSDLRVQTDATIGASGGTLDTAGSNATFSSSISGPGALTKTGAGNADLTATNTYAGGTILRGGSLGIATEANIGGATSSITFEGGLLRINGSGISNLDSHAANWSSFDGGIDVAGATHTFTVSQTLGGAGGFTKAGAGTLLLTSDNSHSGGTTVAGGTLVVANNAKLGVAGAPLNLTGGTLRITDAVGSVVSRPVALANASTIDVASGGGTVELSQPITGSGSLTKVGPGTLLLSAANTHTGTTTLAAGAIKLANANALSQSTLNLTGAGTTFDLGGFNATFGGLAGSQNLDLKGTHLVVGANSADTAFSGAIVSSGGVGSLEKIGSGVLTLTGNNTFTGGTTIKSGTVGITTDANIGGAASAITFDGGSLRINSTTLANLNSHVVNWSTFNGGFDIATGTHTFTVSQSIAGSGSLTKAGPGVLVLSGTNSYTGGTLLKDGILSVASEAHLAGSSSAITFDGGLLRITGTAIANLNSHAVNWSTFNGGIDVAGSTHTFTVSQTISGNGSFTKAGAGTAVLSAANTFTGDTIIAAGSLRLDNANALQFSNIVPAGGTVELTSIAAATFGGIKGSGAFNLKGQTFFVGNNNQDNTYSGAISNSTGTGSLVKVGSGVLTLTGSSTFAGPLAIRSGVVSISSIANSGTNSSLGTGASAAALVLDGGTLRYDSASAGTSNRLFTVGPAGGTLECAGAGKLTMNGTGTIQMSGTGDRIFTLAGVNADCGVSFSIGDPSSGKTSLRKTDGGRWIIASPTWNYSGDTVIEAGILIMNGSANILPYGPGKGNLVINEGQFELNGRDLNINGLYGTSGNINNRGATVKTLTLGNANASGDFGGILSNTGTQLLNVTKVGTGTQILSGRSTFNGAMTVNGGTVVAAHQQALGRGSLTINAAGTVKLSPNLTAAMKLPQITVAPGGKIDLTNNSFVIDYTGSSVLASTVAMILDGRVMSSSVTATTAIGAIDNASAGLGAFEGQTIDSTSVLLKYTYRGDANLDGAVDITDLAALATAWQSSGSWMNGDFDYNGTIDITDLAALGTNWQAGAAGPAMSFEMALASVGLPGVAVPEPAMVLMVAFVGSLVARTRRAHR